MHLLPKKPLNTGETTKAIIESLYWAGSGTNKFLVINGNIEENKNLPNKEDIEVVLISESNDIKIRQTEPVNWYSINKNNYSGFQAIIKGKEVLNKIENGIVYNVCVSVQDKIIKLQGNQELNKNDINISNKSGYITLERMA